MKKNRNYRPAGRDRIRPEASRRPARPQSRPQEEESARGMQREDIVIGRNGVIELLKSGRVQKKNQPELKEHGLSPRMVQCVHVVLNKALEYAVEEKLILANPAKKCKIPKNMRKEMNILPEALIGPYLSAAKEHGILAPMYLELTTGLRRGELLALRWEDLDVQNRTLSINKSVYAQRVQNSLVVCGNTVGLLYGPGAYVQLHQRITLFRGDCIFFFDTAGEQRSTTAE